MTTTLNSRLPSLHPLNAERELLELVRGEDAQNFTLTISCSDGRWRVESVDHSMPLTDPRSDINVGVGESFHEAWLYQAPTWAQDPPPDVA